MSTFWPPNVVVVVAVVFDVQARLFDIQMQVEEIMKALANFLETKRGEFPRFNFLSDDELLEILAKQADPHAIQGFLKQLFDGLVKLDFGD